MLYIMDEFKYISLIGQDNTVGETANYLKDNFRIYEVHHHSPLDYPFKISEYSCYICLEGKSEGNIDLQPFCLKANSLAVNIPGQLLEQHSMSRDFHAIGITMSRNFVRELGLPYSFHLDRILRTAPILELKPAVLQSMLSYCTMVQRLLAQERPYQMETLRHLTCAFFYGLSSCFQMAEHRLPSNEEMIMKKFMAEVKEFCHSQRKVLFYADRLHVSACYLSTVIKHASGKSPSMLIDDFVAKEACTLLKTTDFTVQQISHKLGFPSQSFFGKFFKRVTGFSPKEYREK